MDIVTLSAKRAARAMDAANAGASGRRVEDGRTGQRQHDGTDAQYNILKSHLNDQ
jgi:hypothetical protein